jgi:putative exporter of polyketide antibiotics
MRVAALVVAVFTIIIGVVGVIAPDSLTMARQHLLARPGIVLYVAAPIRVTMGIVLILFAPRSRAPRVLVMLGVIMALQGIVPQFIGIERERMLLEQEVKLGDAALRAGAVVALVSGCFIAFVATARRA